MFKPLPTACYILFILSQGYIFGRTKGSHHHYTKSGHRTITIQGKEKTVPAFHIQTNSKSMGITTSVVYKWAETNC